MEMRDNGRPSHPNPQNRPALMRLLAGAGTPREFLAVAVWLGAILAPEGVLTIILLVATNDQVAAIAVTFRADPLA
jgi:hypothetical protein